MKRKAPFIGLIICLFACEKPHRVSTSGQTADFKKAEAFFSQQKNDSAFYYFDKAAISSKDSLEIAMSYNYMASIQTDAGDHFGAQESLTTSLAYLNDREIKNRYCLASDYNELGMTSSRLENYDNAVSYLDSALKFCDDKDYSLTVINNKANVYRRKGAYAEALHLYGQILPTTSKSKKEFPRILSNTAYTKWLANRTYNAAPELRKALNLRLALKDDWGSNASYGHLADYYETARPDSSLFFATAMYRTALKLNSPDDQASALRRLILLNPGENAKKYFERYYKLNDSLQTARNAAKNQFALIRYNVDKAKVENLRLQKDNAEKKYQLIRQSILFYGSVLAFIIISAFALFWYRKRRKQQEVDKQNAIAETNQKASKKVHDTLANDIYRIMKRVQQEPVLDRSWLEDNIDEVYQRARDLSYEILTDPDEFYAEKIDDLIMGFETDDVKIILIGNEKEFWQKLPVTFKSELKYVLQELMVNMQKHSKALNVVVKFKVTPEHHLINYIDDGVGFPPDHSPNNGLQNTGNRIKTINSEITFASTPGSGLEIQIEIPVA
ncbi:MAG: histidine kinase [Mucilaginibacter sp.]|nr:histidine kinase [Mucilaginibacter sp.]